VNVALIYPPTADPTAPYIALPTLAAALRQADQRVLLVDANVEAYHLLLRRSALARLAQRVEKRIARLEQRVALDHCDQLEYLALWQARGDADWAPAQIADALAVLRDRSGQRFFDPASYGRAVATVDSALRLIGAAHSPLQLDFASYRTPFALLSADEIAADARPTRDPFHGYFARTLVERLRRADIGLVGVSIAFPGQVQPAFALARVLRAALPEVALVAGGPALTQLLLRLDPAQQRAALPPFDAAVLFEGEAALVELCAKLERGQRPTGVMVGSPQTDLGQLPAPDFDGLPLDRYLAPELVLPYDASRGCYWGRCAFCHYGLTACGTARYRERPAATVVEQLVDLQRRYRNRLVYFSHDSIAPRLATAIAEQIAARGLALRWASDIRPERSLNRERCRTFAAGGALSVAIGVESAAPRVLELMDKGIDVAVMAGAVEQLAAAGIAVEAMCFTDFPTETRAEALATVRWLAARREQLSLFMFGEFALMHGSRVAAEPRRFGLAEIHGVAGDELRSGIFFREQRTAKSERDRAAVDAAIGRLASGWQMRSYPWAGSLSTSHTLLWYDRFGPGVFRQLAAGTDRPLDRWRTARAKYDLATIGNDTLAAEAAIWAQMVGHERRVSRARQRELSGQLAPLKPQPRRWRYRAGEALEPA